MIEKIEIKKRLGTLQFNTDSEENAHIKVNKEICSKCPHHACTYACPAQCYQIVGGKLTFRYEDCIECGICDIVCDQGAVKWNMPRGTYGVVYKEG